VKIISSGEQFKIWAIFSRDSSTAIRPSLPQECKLEALPNFSDQYGFITSTTSGKTGVVAA